MKTMISLRRCALLALAMLATVAAQAQVSSKLSPSTQVFLNQLNAQPAEASRHARVIDRSNDYNGFVARPDTINGHAYMSAFVRLSDAAAVSDLKALGVVVQSTFLDGKLLTVLIPVDRIQAVAALPRVTRVNASTVRKPHASNSRVTTHALDVISHSAAAVRAGLPKAYDGTGVVLCIIDTGMDFQHIAFTDTLGQSRIKLAYVYDGKEARIYDTVNEAGPPTDTPTEDHGTHTATTAGGSSVIFDENNVSVKVTGDHPNANQGGMAPGADLILVGVNGLSETYTTNGLQYAVAYADSVGRPLVVSNSWGSHFTPHDGTGDLADVYNSLFGDDHPGRVVLFSSANDAGKSRDNEGGGFYVGYKASTDAPLRTILRSAASGDVDGGGLYKGIVANACARDTLVDAIATTIYVLDAENGDVLQAIPIDASYSEATIDLSPYYTGTLSFSQARHKTGKLQVLLSTDKLESTNCSLTPPDTAYYHSAYTLALEFAPVGHSSLIDLWGGGENYFTGHLNTEGYDWTPGNDDMTANDNATIANVISVGAYVGCNFWADYQGNMYSDTKQFPDDGDIAYFSSYATAEASPTGEAYPWITAPGTRVIAGVNSHHTPEVDDLSYYGEKNISTLVVNSPTSPYGVMDGTSMATPVAAGIVALWMQVAAERGVALTVNDVKEIMRETAVTDKWTSGENASHFGHGKIDALKGIEYILEHYDGAGIEHNVVAPEAVEVARYNVQGQPVGPDYRGMVIIRYSNNTARKVLAQ